MRFWTLVLIFPIICKAADREFSCEFDKPLPMLKTVGNKAAINITSMKFVYSQNGFGGYLVKTYFVGGSESFLLDERFRSDELRDKGFNITTRREKSVEICDQKAQAYFSKTIKATTAPPQSSRIPAAAEDSLRRPAQEAVNAIEMANQGVKNSGANSDERPFGKNLQDKNGKACLGFRCNTNPEPRPVVQNDGLKKGSN